MANLRQKIELFIENIGEATAACLFTMVQGNLLALTLGHVAFPEEHPLACEAIDVGSLVDLRSVRADRLVGVVVGVDEEDIRPRGGGVRNARRRAPQKKHQNDESPTRQLHTSYFTGFPPEYHGVVPS